MKLMFFLVMSSIAYLHFFGVYSAENAVKNLDIRIYETQSLNRDIKNLSRQLNLNFSLRNAEKELRYLIPTEYELRQIRKTVNYLHRNSKSNVNQVLINSQNFIETE